MPGIFAAAPAVDGELLLDESARRAVATDLGNITSVTPAAVLRPRSAQDIAALVGFCHTHGISVSTRGQAHTTLGQGLSDGLVIENRHLNRIHSLDGDVAEVDAGVLWRDLVTAAFEQSPRRTPPAVTGYTSLTVGGTLSVGGLGGLVGALRTGLQVDHVRELEVVTGTGELVRCSPAQRRDLFEAVLGGLGQCGVITKAVVELEPARERARSYVLDYTDNADFFRDLRTLIERPGIDHVYAELYSPQSEPTHRLYATVMYDPANPPDDEAGVRGLTTEPVIDDTPYLDYVFKIDTLVDGMRETVHWDELVKPWYDVWLGGAVVEDYVDEVQSSLTARDIGPFGISLLYPQCRTTMTRPYPPVPEPDGSDWVFVLDINTVAETRGAHPEFVEEMLDRNDRLLTEARKQYGAVLYPIGSLRRTAQDWRDHYGDRWPAFSAAKKRFDPRGILAPGLGIRTDD
ncbi:FAD-binding protein [Nocardia brasiliensis]|uniref:Oxidoreductase n=1 Tax=Nocardia brasiliensis (strain ATCC 700358 / HUJEG-1) TaxID=1133849 RepID=K0EQY2_NOCB7|nr:FAD-binding protein [Nocardia brasiliensis]AFU02203.1 oxidoreductase [Nocardia brasiliensis ATCC 700358]OCF87600.1 oxidoreductase [Nocardia brasiliensis]